jgi:hypothetical protein
MSITDVLCFVEKYPKIKYTIFDRPHNDLEMDLCETSRNTCLNLLIKIYAGRM